MFGSVIKNRRIILGITQTELAEKVKVASNTVSQWESGERSPSVSKIPLIANALGCSIDDLFNEEEKN